LLGAAMLAPFAFWNGVPDFALHHLGFVALMGALSAAAHFLTIAAYRRTDAATLSPFMYFNLITTGVIGFALFSEVPSIATITGMFVVALGGLALAAPQSASDRMMMLVGRKPKLAARTILAQGPTHSAP
jgi:drug/metabolite transporter (DMT)-like permease